MITKKEQKSRIDKTQRRALKLLNDSSDPKRKIKNPRGAEINRLLERVINWESLYLSKYGIELEKNLKD
jgi:hypothetical protein